jgi:hypothetical protein
MYMYALIVVISCTQTASISWAMVYCMRHNLIGWTRTMARWNLLNETYKQWLQNRRFGILNRLLRFCIRALDWQFTPAHQA